MKVCGMKNELCMNGGAHLDFKASLGMRVKGKQMEVFKTAVRVGMQNKIRVKKEKEKQS